MYELNIHFKQDNKSYTKVAKSKYQTSIEEIKAFILQKEEKERNSMDKKRGKNKSPTKVSAPRRATIRQTRGKKQAMVEVVISEE